MFGQLYEQALDGERCWIRGDDGEVSVLPVNQWLGGRDADEPFDSAVVAMCEGPTIELGCGPARLIARLNRLGVTALGVDQSAAAVRLAQQRGAPVLRADVFGPLPEQGHWQTALLADGTVGLGGDPRRIVTRAAQLLCAGGRCLIEFDPDVAGLQISRVRLESEAAIGEWFPWATVGVDSAAMLAEHAGLALTGVHQIGERVMASMTASS
jgi:SAM-dependent methyltransferase